MVDYKIPEFKIYSLIGGVFLTSGNKFLVEMGERLATQRKSLKLTQENLAELSGVSVKTISSAEKGKKALRPENIVRICHSLELDISYLMTGNALHSDISVSLTHKQRIALNKIIDAFLSICQQDMEL